MKNIIVILTVVLCAISPMAKSQTQKGWFLIGTNVSNLGLDFQEGNTNFSFELTPRVAWFIKDNYAVGAEVLIGISTSDGYTSFTYGVGPIGRYYFPVSTPASSTVKRTRWFLDANAGIFGTNTKVSGEPSTNTNGLGLGFGPGIAFFLNQNIALETLAKYNLTVGFGSSTTTNSIRIALGFQIYLPTAKLREVQKDVTN